MEMGFLFFKWLCEFNNIANKNVSKLSFMLVLNVWLAGYKQSLPCERRRLRPSQAVWLFSAG